MPTLKQILFGSMLICGLLTTVIAQQRTGSSVQRSSLTITGTDDGEQARIAAFPSVVTMRSEFYALNAAKYFNQKILRANLFNWYRHDDQAQLLAADPVQTLGFGTTIAGRLTKWQEAAGTLSNSSTKPITDPSGTIRAERFLIGKPKLDTGGPAANADSGDSGPPLEPPPATQNQLAKFTDNTGTLGDSGVTETATGNVGIGTTSPAAKLDVRGAIISNSSVGIGEITNPSFTVDLRTNGLGAAMGVQLENSGDTGGDDAQIIFKTHLSRTFSMGLDRSTGMFMLTPNSTTLGAVGSMAIDALTGNVSIGTNTPDEGKLFVEGGSNHVSIAGSSRTDKGIGVSGFSAGSGGIGVYGEGEGSTSFGVVGSAEAGATGVAGGSDSGTAVSGKSVSGVGVSGSSTSGEAGHFEGKVSVTGNVGIGASSVDLVKLFVNGASNPVGVYSFSNKNGGTGVFGESVRPEGIGVKGSSNLLGGIGVYGASTFGEAGHFEGKLIVTGNVGIGTKNPVAKLEVRASGNAVWGVSTSGIAVNGVSSTKTGVLGTTFSGRGVEGSSNTGVGVVAMSGSGNIVEGYGGANSARKFHITNNGTYVAGSDFAEALPARGGKEGYEPGDVLVVSVRAPGTVEKTGQPNDMRLAGVYSTRPGILGADKDGTSRVDPDELPVAIVGIVPTKVSTENGPVQPGDLLTTSHTPGYAMKASPVLIQGVKVYRTGTILGKAIEPLMQGKGLIKVLVTLR